MSRPVAHHICNRNSLSPRNLTALRSDQTSCAGGRGQCRRRRADRQLPRRAGASQAIESARMTVPGYVVGVTLEAVERFWADVALAVGPRSVPGRARSKKCLVGRTGFEPVTSSVSGNSIAVWGVCDGRTESNGESLTWEEFLAGSCSVGGRLMALALICGSHGLVQADNAVNARCRDGPVVSVVPVRLCQWCRS